MIGDGDVVTGVVGVGDGNDVTGTVGVVGIFTDPPLPPPVTIGVDGTEPPPVVVTGVTRIGVEGVVTTTVLFAEQPTVVPPLLPPHVHVQGPVPDTDDAVPAEQRLVLGAVVTVVRLADPQVPFTGVGVVVIDWVVAETDAD